MILEAYKITQSTNPLERRSKARRSVISPQGTRVLLELTGFALLHFQSFLNLLCLSRNPLHGADVDLGQDTKKNVLSHGRHRCTANVVVSGETFDLKVAVYRNQSRVESSHHLSESLEYLNHLVTNQHDGTVLNGHKQAVHQDGFPSRFLLPYCKHWWITSSLRCDISQWVFNLWQDFIKHERSPAKPHTKSNANLKTSAACSF